jgi:hypothetical protein
MRTNIVATARIAETTPRRIAALAAVLGLLTTSSAFACATESRHKIAVFDSASLVVVGDVVRVEPIADTDTVLLTLRVTERLRGWASDEVTLSWTTNFYSGPPAVWTSDPHIIAAAYAPGTSERIKMNSFMGDVRPDLPAIIDAFCGKTGIYPATDANISEFRWSLFYHDFRRGAKLLGIVAILMLVNYLFGPWVKRQIKRETS